VTNGVFHDDAERDSIILRLDERLQKIQEDVRRLREDFCGDLLELKEGFQKLNCSLQELKTDQTQTKTWVGIFSVVFMAFISYLLQKVLL